MTVETQEDYMLQSRILSIEAQDFLERKKIEEILSLHGKTHYTGSYALDMMCWKDIDIMLEVSNIEDSKIHFHNIIGELLKLPGIMDIHFIDGMNFKIRPGLPKGYYLGLDMFDERIVEKWKVDVWILDAEDFEKSHKFMSEAKQKLTPELKELIIYLKFQLMGQNKRVPSLMSFHLYNAVLFEGLRNENEILEFINNKAIPAAR
jgi:hypothetical protein